MSVAYDSEHPHEPALVPSPLEIVETPAVAARLLGSAALHEESESVYTIVVQRAAELTVEETHTFASLLHTVLTTRLQAINSRNGKPEHAYMVDQHRVSKSITDFYNVFYDWPSQISEERRAKEKRTYQTEQIGHAHEFAKDNFCPEIKWLLQLEDTLRGTGDDLAADTTLEVLAAYGAAVRPDYVAARMALMRHTGNYDRI